MHFRSLTWSLTLLILPVAFVVGIITFLLALSEHAFVDPFPVRQFEDVPGHVGILRIGSIWPSNVSGEDIVSLSYAHFSSRDSSTTFLKLKTHQATAEEWIESGQRRLASLSDALRENGQLDDVALVETEKRFPVEVYANGRPDWWEPADTLKIIGTKLSILQRTPSNEKFGSCWESVFWAFDTDTNVLWQIESNVR